MQQNNNLADGWQRQPIVLDAERNRGEPDHYQRQEWAGVAPRGRRGMSDSGEKILRRLWQMGKGLDGPKSHDTSAEALGRCG